MIFRTSDSYEPVHSIIVPTSYTTFKYEVVNLAYRTITLTNTSISWGTSSHEQYPQAMVLPVVIFAIR